MPADWRSPEAQARPEGGSGPAVGRAHAHQALVVLGCRLAWSRHGQLGGAVGRRVRAAADLFQGERCSLIVASGGRVWDDVVEADAMRDALVRLGVPASRIVRERCSQTTRDNARFTSALLSRMSIDRTLLVTCDWHAPRASALFRKCGLRVEVAAARSPRAGLLTRAWRWGRERAATRIDDATATLRASL